MSGFDSKQAMAADKLQEPIYKITVFDNAYPKGIPLEDWVQPPQRKWVGLTDEEAQQTFAKHNCTISTHLAGILARAIEAKLKEKNFD